MASEFTGDMDRSDAWFEGIDPAEVKRASRAIRSGESDRPADWPSIAVESGAVPDEGRYYSWLREATIAAVVAEIEAQASGGDEQIKHAIRTLDDLDRVGNELEERRADWSALVPGDGGHSTESMNFGDHVAALEGIIDDIARTREALRRTIERGMFDIAPNLSALAGPILGARLIASAGSLERLAKLPSGTVQVLGAEDALFAHLTDGAPPPKHGLIYMHEFVRGTRREDRGSASRALAGKLAIAARIDYYRGEIDPDLEGELLERIEHIRGRVEK